MKLNNCKLCGGAATLHEKKPDGGGVSSGSSIVSCNNCDNSVYKNPSEMKLGSSEKMSGWGIAFAKLKEASRAAVAAWNILNKCSEIKSDRPYSFSIENFNSLKIFCINMVRDGKLETIARSNKREDAIFIIDNLNKGRNNGTGS